VWKVCSKTFVFLVVLVSYVLLFCQVPPIFVNLLAPELFF
jgi:uncharacterized membrane protein